MNGVVRLDMKFIWSGPSWLGFRDYVDRDLRMAAATFEAESLGAKLSYGVVLCLLANYLSISSYILSF